MRFNYWIGLLDETYLFLAVCCGLNLLFFYSWDSFGDSINTLVSIVLSSAIILFPFIVTFLYGHPANLKRILSRDANFMARYGSAVSGLNFKRSGKNALIYLTVSIFRKLWLAHIVVFQQQQQVFSIFQINFQAILMMIVVGFTEPIVGKIEGRMNLVNEAFVLFITYHLYQFTEYMTDL